MNRRREEEKRGRRGRMEEIRIEWDEGKEKRMSIGKRMWRGRMEEDI